MGSAEEDAGDKGAGGETGLPADGERGSAGGSGWPASGADMESCSGSRMPERRLEVFSMSSTFAP
jgi:hypothetical protein